jgi:endothelin-converting enzyme
MVENIQAQFSSSLSDVNWMDLATRKVAQDKAEAMKELIGYPDWYANQSALQVYYSGVSIYRKWLLYHQCFRKLKGNHVLHTSHW